MNMGTGQSGSAPTKNVVQWNGTSLMLAHPNVFNIADFGRIGMAN